LPRALDGAVGVTRCVERNLLQLDPCARGSQHQPAAGHVAETGECRGKFQAFAEDWQENVDVLSAGDTAEEDDMRIIIDFRS